MKKWMPPMDSLDFSSPKTCIICGGCCRKMLTSALSENLPKMAMYRNGICQNRNAQIWTWPEMERYYLLEMECAEIKD
jgi:hypothetical protein